MELIAHLNAMLSTLLYGALSLHPYMMHKCNIIFKSVQGDHKSLIAPDNYNTKNAQKYSNLNSFHHLP
jgi:hypothetical protein